MFMKTVLSIIGRMRIRIFVSSTCVTVHSLQGPWLIDVDASLAVFAIAARSKNLEFNRNLCTLIFVYGYDSLQQRGVNFISFT